MYKDMNDLHIKWSDAIIIIIIIITIIIIIIIIIKCTDYSDVVTV